MTDAMKLIRYDSESQSANIVMHAPIGTGKTTFVAKSTKPIFILTENGLGNNTVPHFPLANTLEEVLEYLQALISDQEHQFETVVIDSLDWLEPLIWSYVAKVHSVRSIEDLSMSRRLLLQQGIYEGSTNHFAGYSDHRWY